MLNALILAALSVVPVYTNHNRVAGNVQTMTNIQEWATAVDEAIAGGGVDTNAVRDIADVQITNHVTSGYLARPTVTNGLASVGYVDVATNGLRRVEDMNAYTNSESWVILRNETAYDAQVRWLDPGSGYELWVFYLTDKETGELINMTECSRDPNATHLVTYNHDLEARRGIWITTRLATTNDLYAVATNAYTKTETDSMTNSITRITDGTHEIRANGEFGTRVPAVGWHITHRPEGFTENVRVDWYDAESYYGWSVLVLDDYEYVALSVSDDPNATELTVNLMQAGVMYYGVVVSRTPAHTEFTRLATTNDLYAVRTNAENAVSTANSVSNRQDTLEGYVSGQRVRVSVTNYYGNTSGQLPRLRIEEFITATNTVDGVDTETNYWQTVWDEQNKYDRFMIEATTAISAMTNNLYQTYYQLLQERLNTKAPRAWGTLTSAGETAPAGSVWHTEPNTVFAGGTEYAHAMVGTGVIGVLTTKGAAVYTDGETGRFHFTTDDKTAYFGMNIATRYELGCATDGITVTSVGGNQMVDLLYNVTMSGKPVLYYTPTLQGTITWEQITDSAGGSIPGATVYASWDQSPPAGSEICTINCGQGVSGFFKATIEYAGVSKFETNMMADLAGGIAATNQTDNQMQPVEPYISGGSVLWRVKQ